MMIRGTMYNLSTDYTPVLDLPLLSDKIWMDVQKKSEYTEKKSKFDYQNSTLRNLYQNQSQKKIGILSQFIWIPQHFRKKL